MPSYQWRWYHRHWAATLDRFLAGDIKRLMVFAPPRHGKSQLVSRFLPAYALGLYPDLKIMACSHTASLAASMNRDVQRIMDRPAYHEVFPATNLFGKNIRTLAQGTWMRNSDEFEVVGREGYYRSTGIGGAIAGRGCDVGIIDDPIKSQEHALSLTYREKTWEWYTSDFLTRQAPGARILVTLTRWHIDDLAGRLLQLQADDPSADHWTILKFPGMAADHRDPSDIRAPGEALWPDRFGPDFLASQRANLGSYQYAALYDQEPIPAEGGYFKAGWFGTFDERPDAYVLPSGKVWPKTMCWRFSMLDPATGKNHLTDYTALGSFAVTPDRDMLILNVVRERIRLEDLIRTVKRECERWASAYVGIEASGFQLGVVHEARKQTRISVKEINPEGKSKLVRAMPAIARAEEGKILLPRHDAGWVVKFLQELCNWTATEGDRDDQVDMLSYAVQEARGTGKLQLVEAEHQPHQPKTFGRGDSRR